MNADEAIVFCTEYLKGMICDTDREFLEIAKQALEKQIPTKPKSEKITFQESYEENIEYYCPKCNVYLTSEYEEEFANYCDECGQALDWSDEDK